jgi:hypothetical protein
VAPPATVIALRAITVAGGANILCQDISAKVY